MSVRKTKIIAIVGPTASGKTNLARFLAEQFNGEIVSADSRQVYQYLDIGTGKEGLLRSNTVALSEKFPNLRYINDIPQWLTDFVDPKASFTVAQYQKLAYEVIDNILSRGKLPIITGGTGLYISALIEGYAFKGHAARKNNNLRHAASPGTKNPPDWNILTLGIDKPREELYAKIDNRLDSRIKQGLIEEAESLIARGIAHDRLREFGLEYRYLADLLENKISKEEFTAKLKYAIHAFARRQLTWFRHHGLVTWIKNESDTMERVKQFLDN